MRIDAKAAGVEVSRLATDLRWSGWPTLVMDVTLDRMKAGIFKFLGRASVDGETAVEASLMCTMRKVS